MKRYFVFIALIISTLECISQPNNKLYTQIKPFSDEFNSALMNTNLWFDLWVNYQEGTFFDNINNIRFGDVSAIEPGTYVCNIISNYVDSPRYGTAWDQKQYGANYVCGQLNSIPRYKYGYFEARMKEPASDVDVCTAFWLWGGSESKGGEIDIQENSSNTCITADKPASLYDIQYKYIMRNAVSYDGNTSDNIGSAWVLYTEKPIYQNGYLVDLSEAFHTYGLDWQPHYLDFYLDGRLMTHLTDSGFYYPNSNSKTSISNLPPLILNLWTKRGGQTGNPPPQTDDCRLEIDYFRYYRNRPEIVKSKVDYAAKTVDVYISNGLPDTYTFNCKNCVSSPDTTAKVHIDLKDKNIKLEIQHSFLDPTGSVTVDPVNITFIDSTAQYGDFANSTDLLIAKSIVVKKADEVNVPKYTKDRIVNYIAKDSILLDAGFEVQIGATFSASVGDL